MTKRAKIIDVFPFLDEEGPLLARYLELNEVVDEFIAVEGSLSHSGRKREQGLFTALEKLSIPTEKFKSIFVSLSESDSPFERDRAQRDHLRGYLLSNYQQNDILVFGDVDEVPRYEAVVEAASLLTDTREASIKFIHFAQELCMGFLNNHEVTGRFVSHMGEYPRIKRAERKWLGTTALLIGSIEGLQLSELREPQRITEGHRLFPGGWHFSACSGPIDLEAADRIVRKFKDSAHREFSHVDERLLPVIRRRLNNGKDVLGRRFTKYRIEFPNHFLSGRMMEDRRLLKLIRV